MDSLARFKSSFVDENTVVMTKIQSILSGWFEESESRQAELHLQEELQRRQEELEEALSHAMAVLMRIRDAAEETEERAHVLVLEGRIQG